MLTTIQPNRLKKNLVLSNLTRQFAEEKNLVYNQVNLKKALKMSTIWKSTHLGLSNDVQAHVFMMSTVNAESGA